MKYILLLIIPVILDMIIGDPPNFPHPIRYIGWIIKKYENIIRKSNINLKIGGFFLTGLTLITVTGVVTAILILAEKISYNLNLVISIYFLYTSLASKCLDVETRKVYKSLLKDDINESRKMLSYLVGRDTTSLSEEEVTRGAVETVAENTIDGVLAPLMFIGVGLYFETPVQFAFLYKSINTLDSMVGYINEKYKDIGFASAKLDDIANYIPARLGSCLMLIGGYLLGYNLKNGFKILKRDNRNHKSPNCGYPESVVAGLLNIQLGGINTYFGEKVYKPTIGDKNSEIVPSNIVETIKIMYASETIMVILIMTILSLKFTM